MKTVVADIETDGLNPTRIWCIVTKDIETGEINEFLQEDMEQFAKFAATVSCWIGHNFVSFDSVWLNRLCPNVNILVPDIIDTLIVSKLLHFGRVGGHSLDQYGKEFGIEKVQYEGWDEWHPDILRRCRVDVEITHKLYETQSEYIQSPLWADALRVEHFVGYLCNTLHDNGFFFNLKEARDLYCNITNILTTLDLNLGTVFLPRYIPREPFLPRYTKSKVMHKVHARLIEGAEKVEKLPDGRVIVYDISPFNPKSAKDRVERLNEAGWNPTSKTKGHIDFLRGVRGVSHPRRGKSSKAGLTQEQEAKKKYFQTYGWKTDEENLATLPDTAPEGARTLKRRLLLQGKATRLEEWFKATSEAPRGNGEGCRIHGAFTGIGSWPHRLSHSAPNMANVPKFISEEKTPYSDKMRGLWQAEPGKVLVGVDAEGIQLRIFAHLINDPELIASLVKGRKEDGTDPHTLNQRIIGGICKSRDAAKRFIYALFFDMGDGKAAEVLDCSRAEAKDARSRLIQHYPGYKELKETIIPAHASKGYFVGLDGRCVLISGEDQEAKEHYCLSGMLQNGEKVITARAAELWHPQLEKEGVPFKLVGWCHDEFIIETQKEVAERISKVVCESFAQVGKDLNLNCPLSGEGKVGLNWHEVH